MNENKLKTIEKLIDDRKINQAQTELSKLGNEFLKNSDYLYLRGKIFYIKELYYIAIDTLLIALEFGVLGLPETFLTNDSGIIIYKHIGPISNEIIENEIIPLL